MAAQAPEMAPARRRGMSSAGRAGSGDGASEVAVVAVEVGEEEGGAREEEGRERAGGRPPRRSAPNSKDKLHVKETAAHDQKKKEAAAQQQKYGRPILNAHAPNNYKSTAQEKTVES